MMQFLWLVQLLKSKSCRNCQWKNFYPQPRLVTMLVSSTGRIFFPGKTCLLLGKDFHGKKIPPVLGANIATSCCCGTFAVLWATTIVSHDFFETAEWNQWCVKRAAKNFVHVSNPWWTFYCFVNYCKILIMRQFKAWLWSLFCILYHYSATTRSRPVWRKLTNQNVN